MHETTQLCIRQLKKYVTKDTELLDVGTGSGILSIIALKLGARHAVGTDLDPCAVPAVEENKEVNGIPVEAFDMMIGNIIDDKAVQDQVGYEKYDIVTANILADVLIPLTPVICHQMKPGALYITSGILDVKEELQHVRSYLEIQQMRYQDILQYEICVPEELNHCQIPKITLQPLVENALYHGIKNKRGKGMIRIEGELDGEDCILLITDNGKGMTPERLEQVRKGIRNRKARETDIYGLYNVNERIRLNFGENYGITITSTYGEGTCVTVRLPQH